MSDAKVIRCDSCGAALNVEANRAYIFCRYCGCKNFIASERMDSSMDLGGIHIKAHTEVESVLSSAEYAVSIGDYQRANDLLLASIMSGNNDYRVYILKARIDLLQDNNASLFATMDKLRQLEMRQSSKYEVTTAIKELMHFRGKNGVTVLHNASFHEMFDYVVYCVEHGSDVNCVAGMNRVTPISIMFVPISKSLSKLDGTPFIRNKQEVKRIRTYLMQHGARDSRRLGY